MQMTQVWLIVIHFHYCKVILWCGKKNSELGDVSGKTAWVKLIFCKYCMHGQFWWIFDKETMAAVYIHLYIAEIVYCISVWMLFIFIWAWTCKCVSFNTGKMKNWTDCVSMQCVLLITVVVLISLAIAESYSLKQIEKMWWQSQCVLFFVAEFTFPGFNIDATRSMVAMHDVSFFFLSFFFFFNSLGCLWFLWLSGHIHRFEGIE